MSRRDSMPPVTVFLSAVSREFHEPDPENPRGFQSYRDVLAYALRRMGPAFSVIVQEDLAQGPGDLLATLDTEIQRSSIVVHLIGNLAGWGPCDAELRRLRGRHPALLEHEPELAEAFEEISEISYTQWEIYLAFEHRCDHCTFVAEPHATRSPGCAIREMEASQVKHLERLRNAGEHRESFENQSNLALKVVTSIVRFGLDPKAFDFTPRAEAVEAARGDAAGLTSEIAAGIRKPDRSLSADLDPAGVEAFLRSVDSASLRRELDRRAALEIVAEHREDLREAVEEEPTAEGLRELALAELAMGDYPRAMEAARRCAELGEARMDAEPERFEKHREEALNGYLLLHDAASAAGKRDEAVAALERGGSFIDKSSEPVFWANYHEPLAEFHLDHAHWDRAEGLIDDIIDIREEHQPEQLGLAKSLRLWCRLLHSKTNYSGMASVAARAERIFDKQAPPELLGVAEAMSYRASALEKLGRFAEAEPMYRRVLAVAEDSYGSDHPAVAIAVNNLAGVLAATNRLAEAEPLVRRALAISERSCGPDHPTVASALNNLALLLKATNRLAEAGPLVRRALAISELSYGPDHPEVATALNNLAAVLAATNRLAEAEPLYRRALSIDERSYGPDHPEVATALNNLALLLVAAKQLAEAEPLYRRAVQILIEFRRRSGHENRNLRVSLVNYVALLQALGKTPEQIEQQMHELEESAGPARE